MGYDLSSLTGLDDLFCGIWQGDNWLMNFDLAMLRHPRCNRRHQWFASVMRYSDGSPVSLGDVVELSVPDGMAKARVVMLGQTYEHLNIDPRFVEWVEEERVLKPDGIVIEWLHANPFDSKSPQRAPVGNYMFTTLDPDIKRAG